MTVPVWTVERRNETYPDGDGGSTFEEWWVVTDGKREVRAEYLDDAELVAAALNAYQPAVAVADGVPS